MDKNSDLKGIIIDKSLNAIAHVIVFVLNIPKRIKTMWRRLRRIEFKVLVLTSVTYISLAILTLFLFLYMKEMISYDVCIMAYVDDIEIGIVKNTFSLEGSRMKMENEINKYLDHEYEFEYDIKYKFINTKIKDKTILTKGDCYNYLNNMSQYGIIDMYSFYIDDFYIGSLQEYTNIGDIINGYKNMALSGFDNAENNIIDVKLYNKLEIIKEERIKTDLSEIDTIHTVLNSGDIELRFTVVRIETFTEVIKCEIEYQDSDTLYIGVENQATEGSDGIYELVYEVEYLGNDVINETLISERFIIEPEPIIILRGSKEPPPAESTGTFIWPIDMSLSERSFITSYFAEQRQEFDGDQYHYGIDISAERGTYIYAADGGYVDYSEETYSYGNMVRIVHKDNKSTYYAHMDARLVEVGEYVYPGQIIGKVGDTGVATAPHLHFEIREDTMPIDPLKFLP